MNRYRILRSLIMASLLGATLAHAQQLTLPLWSHGAPEPSTAKGPERDTLAPTDALIAGRTVAKLTDISNPTLALYKPQPPSGSTATNATATPAVVVFPGGGYRILAYDLEGTEVCAWLNSIHVACVLVKYRVPYETHFPERSEDLEDAQQAMRLTRQHAAEWNIDPKRVGALGFSAGAHLVVVLSNHFAFEPKSDAAKAAVKEHGGLDPAISARPDFALVLYPGYLVHWPDATTIAPEAVPSASTPPTFLLQAEDDPVHEENSLVYLQDLKKAGIPAELHLYAKGGHGYGLRPTDLPITHWPVLAEIWLRTLHVLPPHGNPE